MRTSLGLSLLLLLAPTATADSITKTDGTVLEDVSIVEETLEGVSYTEGRSKKAELVPAAEVLSVSYSELPEDVDAAMGSMSEGDVLSAVAYLDDYVNAQVEKSTERRFKWAPAFAASKAIELRMQLFDLNGMLRASERLLKNYGSSRFVPAAHLHKAMAQAWSGQADDARSTLEKLERLVADEGLSSRWTLAAKVAKARLLPASSPTAQRSELSGLARDAGSFPDVRSLAKLGEAESFMLEAEGITNQSKARELRDKAEAIFEKIVEDPKASDEALAGAYTGLGDCLFFRGASTENQDELGAAVKSYLRVVVIYGQFGQYVPKALFYSMRCFDLLGDRTRKSRMRSELLALYPGTGWAERPEVKR